MVYRFWGLTGSFMIAATLFGANAYDRDCDPLSALTGWGGR
jgi:hypothetical protein